MAMETSVYFVTNRHKSGADYVDKIVKNDPSQMTFAVATGTDLAQENSGKITSISDISFGRFTPEVADRIVSSGRNLLDAFTWSSKGGVFAPPPHVRTAGGTLAQVCQPRDARPCGCPTRKP